MATETAEGYSSHVRSVTVTTLASLAGIAAALVCEYVIQADPTAREALFVVLGAIAVQAPILQVAGFDITDFSAKDYLFIAFMTFSLWFIAWAFVLTSTAA
ncbi:MAG: hypothetical protein ABEI57_06315 [Halapricum sp.]